MATIHAESKAVRGPDLPATITPALLGRLAALVAAAPGAERTTTTAPYTGLPLADLPVSTPDDVDEAFARARVAQRDGRRRRCGSASGSCSATTTWSWPAGTRSWT